MPRSNLASRGQSRTAHNLNNVETFANINRSFSGGDWFALIEPRSKGTKVLRHQRAVSNVELVSP
jgi:NADH:ubiquinone oxidoreductase subunit F (NADH-binding)